MKRPTMFKREYYVTWAPVVGATFHDMPQGVYVVRDLDAGVTAHIPASSKASAALEYIRLRGCGSAHLEITPPAPAPQEPFSCSYTDGRQSWPTGPMGTPHPIYG